MAIDKFSLGYNLGLYYINWSFKQFYSRIYVIGKENIPAGGRAIFGSNHLNALMDALAVLSLVAHRQTIVFVARADIFANPMAAKALRFLRILPAYRSRNGMGNLDKNEAIFEQCADVLARQNCLGIMPEGNQTFEHKMHQLAKGTFRIAFRAQEKIGDFNAVRLVPVGIDMDNLLNPGHDLIINVGAPLDVRCYMTQYEQNPVLAINALRADYMQALSDVTVDYRSERYYDTFEMAGNVACGAAAKELFGNAKSISRFRARQRLAKQMVRLEAEEPQKIELLDSLVARYRAAIGESRLAERTFNQAPPSVFSIVLHALTLLVLSPCFLVGIITSGLPFLATWLVVKALKLKEQKFVSSLYYVISALATFPLFYLLNTLLVALVLPLSWWWAIAYLFLQYPLARMAFFWFERVEGLFEQIAYRRFRRRNRGLFGTIQELRDEIIALLKL